MILESLAITVLSLGIYPFLLGVCMLGETILSGRITDNIENLADVIDKITAAKNNVLNPQIAVSEEGTDHLTQLLPEVQQEIFSLADNRAAISETSRSLNQTVKAMPGALLNSDISFLKLFLQKNKVELLNDFNTKFNLSENKSNPIEIVDAMTLFCLDNLTKENVEKLSNLRSLSQDFKDLLSVNRKLQEIKNKIKDDPNLPRETRFNLHHKRAFQVIIINEKGMFNKAIEVVKGMHDTGFSTDFRPTYFASISKAAYEKNRFAIAIKAANLIDNNKDRYKTLKSMIHYLCEKEQFGTAIKVANLVWNSCSWELLTSSYNLEGKGEIDMNYDPFQPIFKKLCEKGMDHEALQLVDFIERRQNEPNTDFKMSCKNSATYESLKARIKRFYKNSAHYEIVKSLCDNEKFIEAEKVANTIEGDKGIRFMIKALCKKGQIDEALRMSALNRPIYIGLIVEKLCKEKKIDDLDKVIAKCTNDRDLSLIIEKLCQIKEFNLAKKYVPKLSSRDLQIDLRWYIRSTQA